MSTYNGEQYLREQLDSLLEQDVDDMKILVRDDGSTDMTKHMLEEYQSKGLLKWYTGPNLRPAKSFMNLLRNSCQSEYYAFCDQDDIWMKDKVSVAIKALEQYKQVPAMYCSNTMLVDKHLNKIRVSNKLFKFTFGESLITNPVTGCTMVINDVLRNLLLKQTPTIMSMHDWWIYTVCLAFNGHVIFDESPHIFYRQHGKNVIGAMTSKSEIRKKHFNKLFNSGVGLRYQVAEELYRCYGSEMPNNTLKQLKLCLASRKSFLSSLRFAFSKDFKVANHSVGRSFKMAVLLRRF